MEIHIAGKHLISEVTTALDVSGREHLVVVVKSAWRIPQPGQRPRPIMPAPLVQADEFHGEPGLSAMRYGSDLARFKPRCDVIFDACAHAPQGQPVKKMKVSFKVGKLEKSLLVMGPRYWRKTLGMPRLSSPEPFVRMPLHFGLAYGGTRAYQQGRGDKAVTLSESLLANPVGLGWLGPKTRKEVDELPAPCLQAADEVVRKAGGKYRPVAFSAVARHWEPRSRYVGTYDAHWEKEVCPFLPEDFDEQYHQCASEDQQMPYPKGGEEVVLRNMMAGREEVRFKLPRLDLLKVRILRKDYSTESPEAVVDTLYFEPEEARFSAVWRASVPIQRRIQEFDTIAIGPIDLGWWHDKILGLDGSGCKSCGNGAEAAA